MADWRHRLGSGGGTPRVKTPMNTPRSIPDFVPRIIKAPSFIELYPEISVDAIADMTIDRLLLMSREDFLALSNYDFVQGKLLSVYRFILYSNKNKLRNGAARIEDAIERAVLHKEDSENLLLTPNSKKSTPRSPTRKKKKNAQKVEKNEPTQ